MNESAKSKLRDFVIPFNCLSKLELKQPIFGSNYVIADVKAAPGGGWEGTTQINLTFNSGGCIEFGKFVLATANSSRTQTVYTQPQFGLQGYPAPPPNPYIQNQQGQFNAATGMYEFPSNSQFNYGAPMAPPVAGQRLPDAPPRYEDLPQVKSPSQTAPLPFHSFSRIFHLISPAQSPKRKMINPNSERCVSSSLQITLFSCHYILISFPLSSIVEAQRTF